MAKDIWLDLVFANVYLCICFTKQIPGTELLRPLQHLQARPVPEGFQRRVILCHGHVWLTGSDHAMKQVMKVTEIEAWKELLRYKHIQTWWSAAFLQLLLTATKSSAGGHLPVDFVPLLQYGRLQKRDCLWIEKKLLMFWLLAVCLISSVKSVLVPCTCGARLTDGQVANTQDVMHLVASLPNNTEVYTVWNSECDQKTSQMWYHNVKLYTAFSTARIVQLSNVNNYQLVHPCNSLYIDMCDYRKGSSQDIPISCDFMVLVPRYPCTIAIHVYDAYA